ncbi:MAG: hypothetical protein WD005_04220 [Haliea sp.]
MKTLVSNLALSKQRGAVTLLTALILLIAVTPLALFSSRIVINETQMAASDYRTSQAVETAMAAFDRGLADFNAAGGRIDAALTAPTQAQLDALVASCTTTAPATSAQEVFLPDPDDPTVTRTLGLYYFANTGAADRCGGAGDPASGTIVAMGWSDDCEAQRTMSACLGTVPLFRDGQGPKQPFVSNGSVDLTGNARIINRFTNISIWTGVDGDMSGDFSTRLRPSGVNVQDLTPAELQSNTDDNTQLVSDNKAGRGLDIFTNDISLANLNGDDLFGLFFAQDKNATKELATELNGAPPVNSGGDITSGLYWIDSNLKLTASNEEFGSIEEPIILIVDGDLEINGPAIYGMVYVTGELKISGNMTVYGSMVSESVINTGGGTPEAVFVPFGGFGGMPPPPIVDSGVVIPGSWRDW